MAKKGKKGKKKGAKKPAGPPPVTTVQMIADRTKMLAPRMVGCTINHLLLVPIHLDVFYNVLFYVQGRCLFQTF